LSTPDFRAAVRRRLSGIDDVDEDVVAELAAQLEDAYAAALERGAGEAQAWQDVESEILGTESWRQLDRYLRGGSSIATCSTRRRRRRISPRGLERSLRSRTPGVDMDDRPRGTCAVMRASRWQSG
jgi:hypothetical protein